jgi:hypothetical protein
LSAPDNPDFAGGCSMDRMVGVKDLHERIGHPVIDADGWSNR